MSEHTLPSVPKFAKALREIGRSTLSSSERTLLYALVAWWNPKTLELWPSMPSIAAATGFTIRGVRKIVRRLEGLGILELIHRSKGGAARGKYSPTNRYRLRLDRLPSASAPEHDAQPGTPFTPAPEPRSAREGTAFRPTPEPSSPPPGTAKLFSPEPGSAKTTMHETTREPFSREPSRANPPQPVSTGGGCMHAKNTPSLRDTLIDCGIRGVHLEQLASSPQLTRHAVLQEHLSVKRDPTTRNIAAVLATRLMPLAGITPRSPRLPLDASSLGIVAKIEALRRNRRCV